MTNPKAGWRDGPTASAPPGRGEGDDWIGRCEKALRMPNLRATEQRADECNIISIRGRSMAETWQHTMCQSGTQVVSRNEPGKPHLYVYGPIASTSDDDARIDQDRAAMCRDLVAFLNGGTRPAWLDDMDRIDQNTLRGLDNSSIRATGPMVDRNPPACDWWECETQASKDARAELIDRLHLKRTSAT